jgi:hypothetical protein
VPYTEPDPTGANVTLKSFTTANDAVPESAFEDAEPIEFDIDGEPFIAYPPTGGQLALVMASAGKHSKTVDRVVATIDFLDSLLDEEGQERIRERLMDRNDPFDLEQVEDILDYLVKEWSARPTKQPSDYRRSQSKTTKSSTAKRPSRAAKTS